MKTIVLLINFLCLTSLSVLGQDTLTVVYLIPTYEKENNNFSMKDYYDAFHEESRQQVAEVKKLTNTKFIKKIEAQKEVFDTISFDKMLKVSSFWVKTLKRRGNCGISDPSSYCIVWTMILMIEYQNYGETFTYLLYGDVFSAEFNRSESFRRFLSHQQQINLAQTITPFTGLHSNTILYTKEHFEGKYDLKKLLQVTQKFVEKNTNQKLKMVYPLKQALEEKITINWQKKEVLQLYGATYLGKAFLVDSHTGLLLKEIDLSKFAKKK